MSEEKLHKAIVEQGALEQRGMNGPKREGANGPAKPMTSNPVPSPAAPPLKKK